MQVQRTRDTAPEVALRKLLHASGLRYRVDAPPLPGVRRRADVVFRSAKVAVFVDGCFWHGCPDHGRAKTAANTDYWQAKLERNRARDSDTDQLLRKAGWEVVRVWEHVPATEVAVVVERLVRERRALLTVRSGAA